MTNTIYTPVITPMRYRTLQYAAAIQIARTLGRADDDQQVLDAATNATASVLNVLGVAMVPDSFPLESVPNVEQQLANAEAYREWLAGRDG